MEPSQEVKNFARFLRKKTDVDFTDAHVLDLGCGVGKHAFFFESLGATVIGYDIARNALQSARARVVETKSTVTFFEQNIGKPYPLPDQSIDIVLDVMSSNSLTEGERRVYVSEIHRVLKPGGWLFVRALCKDGDKNAHALLKEHPWKEKDTYLMPKSNFHERVFTEQDILALYESFLLIKKEKKHHYTRFEGVLYKRNYFVLYLQKASR